MHAPDIAPLRSESPPQKRSGMAPVLEEFQFCLHTHTFIRKRNEPFLPLPSQPQLVLIYRTWRDGRLSWPGCEVASVEIRTCNLPIANPALYHTATSGALPCIACTIAPITVCSFGFWVMVRVGVSQLIICLYSFSSAHCTYVHVFSDWFSASLHLSLTFLYND